MQDMIVKLSEVSMWIVISFYLTTSMQGSLSHEQNVRLSNAWIVTKQRNLCRHSYTIWKTIQPNFLARRMVGGGWPLLLEILGRTDLVGAKMPIFNWYSGVAPQP